MKLSKLIIWITFLSILAMATHVSIDSDTWWHLKSGQWMVENKQLMTEDPFSYTRQGIAWQYPGLWVQILMYGIFKFFGPGGVNVWVSIMIVIIFAIIWKTTSGNMVLRSFILILSAAASAIYWAARPYLVTYLMGALFFLILTQYAKDKRQNLYILLVLMVIWVNSHGGYLAGFLFFGPFLVEAGAQWLWASRNRRSENSAKEKSRFKHLSLIGVLLFVVTLINPQGFRLWTLPFTTVSRQAEQLFIAEWQSPNFHEPSVLPFGFILILLMIVLGASRRPISVSGGLLISGFGLLSLISIRNIFFFVIVTPGILSEHIMLLLQQLGEKLNIRLRIDFDSAPTKIQSLFNIILVVLVSLVALMRIATYLPSETNWVELGETFPASAVDYIKETRPEGRMFNAYNFGGYLIWALPEYPVFVDGRADLHQDEIILSWYRVIQGSDDWIEVFKDWDIGFVLIEPTVPLVRNLVWAGWEEVYSDDVAVVYVKP